MSSFFDPRRKIGSGSPQERQLIAIAHELDAALRRAAVLARAAELDEYPEELEFARVYLEQAAHTQAERLKGQG